MDARFPVTLMAVQRDRSIPSATVDLAGHRWTFSETLADVAPDQWGGILIDPD